MVVATASAPMRDERVCVLTRTSGRPRYFALNRRSVETQTHQNVTHVVSCDNDATEEYVRNYAGVDILRVERAPRSRHRRLHFPYNSYLNTMIEYARSTYGATWFAVLDDDNVFVEPDSVRKALEATEGDRNRLVLWRVRIGQTVVPKRFGQLPLVRNDVDMNGFLLHSSSFCSGGDAEGTPAVLRFEPRAGGDYLFLRKVMAQRPSVRVTWCDKVLSETSWIRRPRHSKGARHDHAHDGDVARR